MDTLRIYIRIYNIIYICAYIHYMNPGTILIYIYIQINTYILCVYIYTYYIYRLIPIYYRNINVYVCVYIYIHTHLYIYWKWRGSINIDNYFLGQIDLKLRQKGWQNHWQRGRGNSRYPISRVLWPANLAAEPVANSVEAKNHGICAGKWYGRAS